MVYKKAIVIVRGVLLSHNRSNFDSDSQSHSGWSVEVSGVTAALRANDHAKRFRPDTMEPSFIGNVFLISIVDRVK
jgi:hypothetical protein